MYNLLDNVLRMEKAHGPHRDPTLLERTSGYTLYGPLGICVSMRESYSDLVSTKQWPALTATIPSSNLGYVQDKSGSEGKHKNPNGMKCHICGSEYHLKFKCPDKPPTNGDGEKNDGGQKNDGSTARNSDWRYCKPADDNATMTVNDLLYKYCKHCKCKRTGRIGFFNRTHSSSEHKFPRVDAASSVSSGATTATEDSTVASSISSLGSTSAAAGNLGAVITPASKVVSAPSSMPPVPEHDHVDPDPDGLEFVGAFIADDSQDGAAWVANTMDPPSFSVAVGAVLNAADDNWYDAIDSLPADTVCLPSINNDADTVCLPSVNNDATNDEQDVTVESKPRFIDYLYFTDLGLYVASWFLYSLSIYIRTFRNTVHHTWLCTGVPWLLKMVLLSSFYASIIFWDTITLL